MDVKVTVNGETYERDVEPRKLLIHFLRDDLDLTGSHIGCDTGNCGACSVIVDGVLVKSCMMLAVQTDGSNVETVEGLAQDGVYGTLTGDEVAILTDPFFELSTPPGAHIKDYALAVGKVRHVGDPVAAVVARTRDLARDAAELVEVEYEALPPVLDGETALKDEVILHDDAGSNVVWSGTFDWGDFEAAVAEADHVVRIERLHFDRFSSTPLECSGCLVEYNRGTGQWTIHGNHQMPGVGAIWMAPALRVGLDKLRFVSQDIGGGFGNKITLHPQFTACCLLARKLNRPIQWTEWRAHPPTPQFPR